MSNDEDLFVDGETLISEVRKRPLLYDPSSAEYNDRSKRAKCWEEVAKHVIANWGNLSPIEKAALSRDIQKRWRSIRDSFLKDYKKRKILGHSESAKRKKYIFHKQMMFIIPMIEKRRNVFVTTQPDTSVDDTFDETIHCHSQISSHSDDTLVEKSNENNQSNQIQSKMDSPKKDGKTSTPPISQRQEEDEDKMFLLSLLPLFKIMKEDIKLTARIKVLELVRQSLQTDSFGSFHSYQCNNVISSNSQQDLKENILNNDSQYELQPVVSTASEEDLPIVVEEINESLSTTACDFKSEPESPQLIVEERDPLSSTNDTSFPRKRLRTEAVVKPRAQSAPTEDVFDAIGKNVAHKLRGMVHQQRIIAEKIISDVMYHGQMETLTVNSHLALNKDVS